MANGPHHLKDIDAVLEQGTHVPTTEVVGPDGRGYVRFATALGQYLPELMVRKVRFANPATLTECGEQGTGCVSSNRQPVL